MRPILFSKNSTSFNTNGIGRLEPMSCYVTEERNSIFELDQEEGFRKRQLSFFCLRNQAHYVKIASDCDLIYKFKPSDMPATCGFGKF